MEENRNGFEDSREENAGFDNSIPGPTKYDRATNSERYYAERETEDNRSRPPREGSAYVREHKNTDESYPIISLVLGISSLLFLGAMPIVGIVFAIVTSIVGIVLGAKGKASDSRRGMATAGYVISIVSLVLSILALILLIAFGGAIINAIMWLVQQNSPVSPFMLP